MPSPRAESLRLYAMTQMLQSSFPALYLVGALILLQCPLALCGCKIPPSIAHGSYKYVNTILFFPTEVEYKCDEGYVLVGKAKITCTFSSWSSPAPQCKALCLKPEIENGKLYVDKDQYVETENVIIKCDPGYGVVGLQSITCSENRTWYPRVPKCEWEAPEGCKQVLSGRCLMQCLPRPQDVKMALEVYKLSLEIEQLARRVGLEEEH
ncbi:C4b-binding protein alpha chain-like [Elephas maximus indicus]|uniref:C4b-binding protein alpha chain-like n=1 Tax=Elephas maximus indicus TaxID=99487 RepID=UPI00211651F4|nr:C4b-binding protein alpha chain-like [Elephas maximus indicus]XP_049714525.1 C4b-binding protein alpha chain-like [Elephas maximus indicus]XP_049714526.1 C4b-binding protein alpha chain-like [Elephas maximus indicus]